MTGAAAARAVIKYPNYAVEACAKNYNDIATWNENTVKRNVHRFWIAMGKGVKQANIASTWFESARFEIIKLW